MDGWIDGWLDGWMDGWLDEPTGNSRHQLERPQDSHSSQRPQVEMTTAVVFGGEEGYKPVVCWHSKLHSGFIHRLSIQDLEDF